MILGVDCDWYQLGGIVVVGCWTYDQLADSTPGRKIAE